MSTLWRKALRDVRNERARTLMVVLAIAVGIAGFMTVLASYAILTRELNEQYLATNPAAAILRTDAVDDTLLAAIKATPGVRDAEARRAIGARVRAGTRGWRNAELFVIDDFSRIRISTLNRERGAWPPATGELLIERDAFQVAHARVGDDVNVRTTNGVERTLHVSGGVHDVGQAQARMENMVYGYVSRATLAQLGEAPVLDRVLITVDGNALDERHINNVAQRVSGVMNARGHHVTRTDIPTPGKHPHADIMGMLLLSLAAFGLLVMILSGVIVINLLTAIMAAQVRQIGVMKALGGTTRQVSRIYFAQSLILGAFAVVAAVPIGIAGSRALCRSMAVFLNFDINSFSIPLWVYALVAFTGLIVPLLAAAWPVWKGTRVSIRAALADFGVAQASFGRSRIDRLLASASGVARPLLLALRNNFRRRTRLAFTVLTLACGGLFFMTALNLRASLVATLDRLFDSRKFDLGIAIAGTAPVADVERIVRATPGVRSAEAWLMKDGTLALPAESDFVKPDVVAGRWLRGGDANVVVVNSAYASKHHTRLGDRIGARSVIGIIREPFTPSLAYAPRTEPVTNSARVVLEHNDAASIDAMKGALEERLARAGIRITTISSKADTRFSFDEHMVMIYVALIIMSAMIGAVGGLGLMTTMSVNVLERRREMGVLRAIGARPRTISLILVAEGIAASLIAWLLALLAAWPLGKVIGALITMLFRTGIDFSFELRGVAIWLLISIALGALASFIPSWNAARRPVREALGYE